MSHPINTGRADASATYTVARWYHLAGTVVFGPLVNLSIQPSDKLLSLDIPLRQSLTQVGGFPGSVVHQLGVKPSLTMIQWPLINTPYIPHNRCVWYVTYCTTICLLTYGGALRCFKASAI